MKTRLLASTLLAASLIAAPAIAFAQSETTTPEAKSDMTKSDMAKPKTSHHAMRSTHMKKGMTTGMSSKSARPGGKSVMRKPPGS